MAFIRFWHIYWTFWEARLRDKVMFVVALLLALALLAALGVATLKEQGSSNSYALVADSLLQQRADVPTCFDTDCAVVDGKSYVIFPPLPGVAAMPLVAAMGVDAAGFIALATVAAAMSLFLWNRIFNRLEVPRNIRLWLLLGLAFASPLYFVTLRADGIWFFAQAMAFPLVTLALHETLARRFVLAATALGLAVLCRQMSLFIAPFLFVMALPPEMPLLRVTRQQIVLALKSALPLAAAVAVLFAYNYWRFGNPLESGYQFMMEPDDTLKTYGLWNGAYALFNGFYLLLQGFHAEFDPTKLRLTGLDNGGTGVLAASPWLIYVLLAPWRREVVVGALTIAGLVLVMLFYHSNGYTQYNTQRYILDWLPVALLMIGFGFSPREMKSGRAELLKPLVLWGMVLNVAMLAVLFVTRV